MKILLVADVHLDTPFAWATPAQARARRQAIRDSLTRTVRLAGSLGADLMCVAGDLYEQERFAPDTAAFLQETFDTAGCPVLLAPGNHDWYGPASLYAQTDWPSSVHVFTDDRLTPYTVAEGFTIWGAAHRAPANTDNFLDGFHTDRAGVNIGLFHGSEQGDMRWQEGGKAPHAPFHAHQIAQAGLAHAMLGHFHTPRDAYTHTYPGNPEPLTFGETGDRGAVLLTFNHTGLIERTRHSVSVTDIADLVVDVTGVTHTGQIHDLVAAALAEVSGLVRLTLTGEVSPDVDVRTDGIVGHDGIEALVVRLKDLTTGYDLDALAVEQTVRGQFVNSVRAADLDDNTKRKVLITGLRALEGRKDLAVR